MHGVQPDDLRAILEQFGEVITIGKSFGVYAVRGYDLDIAIPRKEKNTGRGHRDFEIYTDPFLGVEAAARRRDFTINALMQDVLTGEIVDCFGGQEDLKNGIIRHIDPESFVEDPLRVLRAAQFAARFEFTVADETMDLCRDIDLSALPAERVTAELKKALCKGRKPSIFFEVLREMDQLDCWFPELVSLIGLEQDPIFHPEGDVWTHVMAALDKAVVHRVLATLKAKGYAESHTATEQKNHSVSCWSLSSMIWAKSKRQKKSMGGSTRTITKKSACPSYPGSCTD